MKAVPTNVYAAPKSAFREVKVTHCWRDGGMLVAPAQARLPPRCVKCNEPAILDKPRAFYWNHPGWYALLVAYVLVAPFVRKKAFVSIGLCDRHRRRRRNVSWSGYGLFALGFYLLFSSVDHIDPSLAWLGCLAMIAGTLLTGIGRRLLRVASIRDHEIRLKGCGPAFLDSLPTR